MCHKNRASRRACYGRRQPRPTLVGMLVEHVVANREEKRTLNQGAACNQTPQSQTQMHNQTPVYDSHQGYAQNQGYGQAAEYYQNQSRGLEMGESKVGGEKREHWVDEKKWNGEGGGDVNAGLVDEEVAPPRYSVVARS